MLKISFANKVTGFRLKIICAMGVFARRSRNSKKSNFENISRQRCLFKVCFNNREQRKNLLEHIANENDQCLRFQSASQNFCS